MNLPYQSHANVPLACWEESIWSGELEGGRQAYCLYFQLVEDPRPWFAPCLDSLGRTLMFK